MGGVAAMRQESVLKLGARFCQPGRILCVVGARPNYMKIAPMMRAFERSNRPERPILVHTGQHYDAEMNGKLFADLELPAPDINLGVGSGSHAVQTAEVMHRFEPVLEGGQPACVIVVGDVNSTLACALVAAKRHVPVVHIEAGLRSFDRSMPEEINRVLTDQISDLLFTTERTAHANLAREGIDMSRVHFVGNVMIDSLLSHRERAPAVAEVLSHAGARGRSLLDGAGYGVVTLHRPSNVDESDALREALVILADVSQLLPLVWPLHPRTRANVDRFGLADLLDTPRIVVLPPQGYLQMVALMSSATLVLTDSGGVQEETTALSVPCLTMRDSTERPITVEQGTNVVVGRDRNLVLSLVDDVMKTGGKRGRMPEMWDGHAAERIVDHLNSWILNRKLPLRSHA
jgi:UDP-N-acetylglucosamine 2-epimerase (non-hydrolysing)